MLGLYRNQVRIAEIDRKLQRSQMMPDFSVGYYSQTMIGSQDVNGVPRTFDASNRFNSFQAGISIPIWIVPYTARSKAAGLKQEAVQAELEDYSRSLVTSFSNLVDEYRKYSSSVRFYETEAVPEANMIIRQATLSYKAGALDYIDYITTLNRALEIRHNYLDAINSCNQAIISIEHITGKLF